MVKRHLGFRQVLASPCCLPPRNYCVLRTSYVLYVCSVLRTTEYIGQPFHKQKKMVIEAGNLAGVKLLYFA
jgi:hypothetical protein